MLGGNGATGRGLHFIGQALDECVSDAAEVTKKKKTAVGSKGGERANLEQAKTSAEVRLVR